MLITVMSLFVAYLYFFILSISIPSQDLFQPGNILRLIPRADLSNLPIWVGRKKLHGKGTFHSSNSAASGTGSVGSLADKCETLCGVEGLAGSTAALVFFTLLALGSSVALNSNCRFELVAEVDLAAARGWPSGSVPILFSGLESATLLLGESGSKLIGFGGGLFKAACSGLSLEEESDVTDFALFLFGEKDVKGRGAPERELGWLASMTGVIRLRPSFVLVSTCWVIVACFALSEISSML